MSGGRTLQKLFRVENWPVISAGSAGRAFPMATNAGRVHQADQVRTGQPQHHWRNS